MEKRKVAVIVEASMSLASKRIDEIVPERAAVKAKGFPAGDVMIMVLKEMVMI